MTTLPPLRRSRPETVQPARPSTITRARLPTDPLQRIIKLVSAVEDAYAPAAAMQPQRSSSSALPPLRSKASTPQPVPTAAPAPPRSQSPRSTLKTKRMMLQHLESCFDSAEGTERTAIMLAEAQSRSRLLAQCDLPREAKQTPELQRAPSPIRTRPGRVPPRHVAKTKTATAYPLRRASVMEQIDRHSVEATEGKEWDWLIAVERQARVQALERSKLQRRIDTKQNRERERHRVASSVVLDVLDDAAALDDLRWEVAQSVVHKGIVAAIAAHAAEAAHKAEVSSVEKRRHQFAEALVERLVGSIAGRDAPAART